MRRRRLRPKRRTGVVTAETMVVGRAVRSAARWILDMAPPRVATGNPPEARAWNWYFDCRANWRAKPTLCRRESCRARSLHHSSPSGKYDPLEGHLRRQTANEIDMSFIEIERMVRAMRAAPFYVWSDGRTRPVHRTDMQCSSGWKRVSRSA